MVARRYAVGDRDVGENGDGRMGFHETLESCPRVDPGKGFLGNSLAGRSRVATGGSTL